MVKETANNPQSYYANIIRQSQRDFALNMANIANRLRKDFKVINKNNIMQYTVLIREKAMIQIMLCDLRIASIKQKMKEAEEETNKNKQLTQEFKEMKYATMQLNALMDAKNEFCRLCERDCNSVTSHKLIMRLNEVDKKWIEELTVTIRLCAVQRIIDKFVFDTHMFNVNDINKIYEAMNE
jgi:hypothetical protein